MTTNVVGPTLVTRTFMPLIERGNRKVIVNISSAVASIGANYMGQHVSYSISKAALNMLVCKSEPWHITAQFVFIQTNKQAKERPDLIPFVVDPGWVKTGKQILGKTSQTLT